MHRALKYYPSQNVLVFFVYALQLRLVHYKARAYKSSRDSCGQKQGGWEAKKSSTRFCFSVLCAIANPAILA